MAPAGATAQPRQPGAIDEGRRNILQRDAIARADGAEEAEGSDSSQACWPL
jgi:hypothetical protein